MDSPSGHGHGRHECPQREPNGRKSHMSKRSRRKRKATVQLEQQQPSKRKETVQPVEQQQPSTVRPIKQQQRSKPKAAVAAKSNIVSTKKRPRPCTKKPSPHPHTKTKAAKPPSSIITYRGTATRKKLGQSGKGQTPTRNK